MSTHVHTHTYTHTHTNTCTHTQLLNGMMCAAEAVTAPKKLRVEAQENTSGNVVAPAPSAAPSKPVLPAFLQPANVAAVYGSAPPAEDVPTSAP